ncbi:MAG: YicC/YloC family endoribonuclease [Candidatus Manganitrophaceae bacterium]
MIRSMTGYGRAEGNDKGRPVVVELRSVNHRFCDVIVRLPKVLTPLEETLKKRVQDRFTRGHIDLSIDINVGSSAQKELKLNQEFAEAYYKILKELKTRLRLSGEIDIALLSQFKEILTTAEPEQVPQSLLRLIDRLLERSMEELEKMRKEEGVGLGKDLFGRLKGLGERLVRIQELEKEVIRRHHERLQKRILDLNQGMPVDPGRLAQEVAILVDRSDISEETARLRIHLDRFQEMVKKKEAVGRALEFMLQEMNREVNTIGSKANDVSISLEVVGMKTEMEKMREQVQNVE